MFPSCPQPDPAAGLLCRLLSFEPSSSLDLSASGLDWSAFTDQDRSAFTDQHWSAFTDQDWMAFTDQHWSAFTDLVLGQELGGLVYSLRRDTLKALGIPTPQLRRLYHGYLRQVSACERRRHWLRPLLRELASRQIAVIALKGTHLAERVYPDACLRAMGDVDLLVPPEALRPAVEALESLGYQAQREFWYEIELQSGHELPVFVKAGAAPVELHWRLFDPGSPHPIDMEALWRRALPLTVSGEPALGLCPEDLLLYLCLHSAHHRLIHGLRLVNDVALTLDHFKADLDWGRFRERMTEWHAERAAFLLLWLASDLLQAPVPRTVLDELRPSDFGEEQAELARALVISLPALEVFIPPHLAELTATRGLKARLRLVLSQLFLPVQVMRRTYALPARSWVVLLYYPVRWLYLLKKGIQPLGALLRGEQKTHAQAQADFARHLQQEALAAWLELPLD